MKISQREAQRLRKRVQQLETEARQLRNRWADGWADGWVNIATLDVPHDVFATIRTARVLGHAVVLVPGTNRVLLYADRLP